MEDPKPPIKKKLTTAQLAADSVVSSKGNVVTRPQMQQAANNGLKFDTLKDMSSWLDAGGKFGSSPMRRDNTAVINPQAPINNSDNAIAQSKKKMAIGAKAAAEYKYYHPEVKDIKSGDSAVDMLYKNQYLMDIPVVGDVIKNKAYEIAKKSQATSYVADIDKTLKNKTEYTGQSAGETFANSAQGKNRVNLIDQYFGKTQLPESQYKPKSDYLTFLPSYSIKENFNKDYAGKKVDMSEIIGDITHDYETKGKKTDFSKPQYFNATETSRLSEMMGVDLGSHKVGVAFDKEKNLPYVSISDAWDFEPENYSKRFADKKERDGSYIQAALLQKAGKPFKVYDRFYFDPISKEYISDEALNKKSKK